MEIRRFTLLAIGTGLACTTMVGCGGSGTSPTSLSVTRLTLSQGAVTGYAYSIDDKGAICGSQSFGNGLREDMGATWTVPSKPSSVPFLDSTTQLEAAYAISPSRNWIAGISHDNGSGTPERAFVYNVKTHQFHVLQLAGAPNVQVTITSIDNSGNPSGQINTGNGQIFQYTLANDTYQTSNLPVSALNVNIPIGYKSIQIWTYSPNNEFVAGAALDSNGIRYPAIWNIATGQGTLIDPAHPGYAFAISNDGTVALSRIDDPSATAQLWTSNSGAKPLMKIAQTAGMGMDWDTTDFECLSPSGNYVCCTGKVGPNYTFSYPVMIRVR